MSMHIVINIACDLDTNKYIAMTANRNFQSMTKSTFEPFDLKIYAINKSLRLPMCGKVLIGEGG